MNCDFVCNFCYFYYNRCAERGGAIYLDYWCAAKVNNSEFYHNEAYEYGGAAGADGASPVRFTETSFIENYAHWEGGALYAGSHLIADHGIYLIDSYFEDNESPYGFDDVWLWQTDFIVVKDTDFDTTLTPASDPTNDPTDNPTDRPTAQPTHQPTDLPTAQPTDQPTDVPTARPTQNPTDDATLSPTNDPTDVPSDVPSDDPTRDPTDEPTRDPTDHPTDDATNEPSESPTIEIVSTSLQPTVEPTADYSEDHCCHAYYVPRYESRCNLLTSQGICVARVNARRCFWDESYSCGTPAPTGSCGDEAYCTEEGERRKAFCESIDEYALCVYTNCDWVCPESSE